MLVSRLLTAACGVAQMGVALAAYHLARQCLPVYSCKCSRHDFTLPQLFACLAVREQQRQSYRGCEALLRDAEHWMPWYRADELASRLGAFLAGG